MRSNGALRLIPASCWPSATENLSPGLSIFATAAPCTAATGVVSKSICIYAQCLLLLGHRAFHSAGFGAFRGGSGRQLQAVARLDPEHTTSVHYFVDGKLRRAVERFLKREREMIEQKREMLLNHSQLKRDEP